MGTQEGARSDWTLGNRDWPEARVCLVARLARLSRLGLEWPGNSGLGWKSGRTPRLLLWSTDGGRGRDAAVIGQTVWQQGCDWRGLRGRSCDWLGGLTAPPTPLLAQDRGRVGRADRRAALLAAEGGAASREPGGGDTRVQPGHGAARAAGGEPTLVPGRGGQPGLGGQASDFHPALQDKEKVSELDAVMEKQKKKVEGNLETEVI